MYYKSVVDVILIECNLSLHKITPVFQSVVIFMSCRILEFKICIFWQHFFIDTYLIEHNRLCKNDKKKKKKNMEICWMKKPKQNSKKSNNTT